MIYFHHGDVLKQEIIFRQNHVYFNKISFRFLLTSELFSNNRTAINKKSQKHPNIKFTFEHEHNNSFSFLDVKICRENNKLTTSMYHLKESLLIKRDKPEFNRNIYSYPLELFD